MGRGSDEEEPRVVTPDRSQVRLEVVDLEAAVPANHRARVIWEVVEHLDLGAFYDEIAARGSAPGRAAIDPKVLLVLWLFATSEGVGSARHLSRLCERDSVYRWICGGIEPNHHTLSDFRVAHGEKLDELLTQILAVLMDRGVVKLRRVAQDGMRVRASAGATSFRRATRLKKCLAEARAHVEALRRELEEDPAATTNREKAARERAARERQEKVERALRELAKVKRMQARKRRRPGQQEPRVSTTDPEARVMKMGDGGYRPAFNVQYATDTASRVIVGVEVTNAGTDSGQLVPMLDQIEERSYGDRPQEHLVDGGYVSLEAIDEAEKRGIRVYMPVPAPQSEEADPHERKEDDTDHTAAWRARMGTKKAQAIYAERAATAETVNADLRTWRGMRQFTVRGIPKVRCIALLAALMHNVLRAYELTSGTLW